ncbi:MAG: hypothetical protein ABI402_12490 [Ferruginibacter sp.]
MSGSTTMVLLPYDICVFKLTGFKEVQEIVFHEATGFKKQGERIATIQTII